MATNGHLQKLSFGIRNKAPMWPSPPPSCQTKLFYHCWGRERLRGLTKIGGN